MADILETPTSVIAVENHENGEENGKDVHPLAAAMDDEEEEIISTILASPGGDSIASTKALIGSYNFEDDDDARDLFIKVDDPMRHTGKMESFVSYRVTTKTTRSSFDNPEYSVRRRYQDFLWLRQKLAEVQPTHLVPPLPEKQSMRLDRFAPEFLAARRRALHKFLERISEHPVLSFNENLQVFVTAKELTAHRRQSMSLMSRMGSSLRTTTTAALLRNRSPEFTVMGEYVQMLGEKLGSIERISLRILQESKDYVSELKTYSPAFRLWSNSETELTTPLSKMADGVEICTQSIEDQNTYQETDFLPFVKEYSLYTESIKTVLKKRDQFQMEHELAVEELNKKKNEREQVKISDQNYSFGAIMGKDPADVKEAKSGRIVSKIEQLQKEVEVFSDRAECANADLKADMERWHHNRRKDMKDMLSGMAYQQIMSNTGILQAWEDVISSLRDEAGFLHGEDPSPMHSTTDPSLTGATSPTLTSSSGAERGGAKNSKPEGFLDINNGLEDEDEEEELNAS
ncbi:sorting nexin-30 isoform X1 [Strongylocentrotus purpuratus]|uniref:PX domain-containing protein n=1 Tax=Strongylocentrotus purpuratus TaxID=7668 RepID=A0A7M7PKX5_STRPU|nr:sorting nexin-30 isoform X1 [Strongylocentrotus purpuratus]|eukprot:XP_003725245.2 PREDICTED: sorting nexin-30 isoform X2 [Strongylocentrotus purpuratus]